jgi:hypothetical protein
MSLVGAQLASLGFVRREARRRLVLGVRAGLVGACLALFIGVLAHADLAAAWERIRAMGVPGLLVLVPFPFGLACDAAAWRRLLAALGRRVRLRTLFAVRIVTEAVNNALPGGTVWSEAAGPLLVSRRAAVPLADAFAASTAKRWLIIRMHGAYVAMAVAVGGDAIAHASPALLGGRPWLPLLVLAGALVLVLLSLAIEALAARADVARRAIGLVGRWGRLREWALAHRHHFEKADAQLARLSTDRHANVAAAAGVMLVWLAEGFETWLVLHLLGARLGYASVVSFDAALSIVRSAAGFAPAGIGVQDVGYLAVLDAYGVADAGVIGPAFVVVKRVKEAFWIGVGLLTFARHGVLAQRESAATQT